MYYKNILKRKLDQINFSIDGSYVLSESGLEDLKESIFITVIADIM